MDLRAKAVVVAAITIERLAPAGEQVARATGFIAVAVGLFLIARAPGLDDASRMVGVNFARRMCSEKACRRSRWFGM